VVTINEVLAGHAVLDIECLDRVYLNAYKIGQKFRRAVDAFAEAHQIPRVRFGKQDRKAEVMAPYLKLAAATGRSQVAAIEWRRSSSGSGPATSGKPRLPPRSSPSPRPVAA
jgi:hypothetical protein